MPSSPLHSVALALLGTCLLAAATVTAQTELRGVWVARDGLTSRTKIQLTLDQLQAANINLVCVNVWSRGYTLYPSAVLQATCGVTMDPDPAYVGRDPFAEFVFEAHRRGIEVEAWFEYGFMFGWSGWYAGANGIGPVLNANPTWIGRDNNGNTQVGDGAGGYFTWASHEHPGVRQFLIDLMVEVVDRYDVDGIQFDRCRYPSTAFGYDPTTAAAYLAATGQNPPTNVNNSAWKRWRADRLIAFHQDFYTAVKARRATVRVTDAPTVWPGSYDNFLQDWPAWLVGGSLDLVYPQVYRTTTSAYITTLDQQLNAVPVALRSKVAPGIRAISGTATNDVLGMVAADRARNLPGHVFWYAEGLYDDLPALTANYFQAPAAIPQRPAGWRPPWAVREENDPTSTFTPGFFPSTAVGTSGGQARIALASASASERVGYSLPVANTGLWTLLAYVPTGVGLATTAPYRLTHAAGTAVLGVDQTAAQPAGWRELGTFWLDQGTAALEIGAMPGQVVMADAVALLRSRLPSGPMATIGVGTGGTLGGLRLSMAGRSGLGGAVVIQANRTPVGSPVVVGLALTGSLVPLFGGTLYVLPLATTGGVADGLGTFATTVGIPFSVSLLGTSLFAQGLALDAAAIDFVSLSAAVATTIQ